MRSHIHAVTVGVLVAATLLAAVPAAASDRLFVRIYQDTWLPSAAIKSARQAAAAVLGDAGLELRWRDCSTGCPDVPASDEVLLRITAAPPKASAGSLGYAVVDAKTGTGKLATVYADRVMAVALRTGTDAGTLLGRAIAHEIGHLLIGTAHSPEGLMRERWLDGEVQSDRHPDWTLTQQNLAELRRVR